MHLCICGWSVPIYNLYLGETVDLSQHLDTSVLTGAVKLYLRELPIPLITFDAYTEIMKATAAISDPEDHNTDWQLLIDALKLLPKAHYATLNHLAQHLYKYVRVLGTCGKSTAGGIWYSKVLLLWAGTSYCEYGTLFHTS